MSRRRTRLPVSPIANYIRKRSTELATAAVRATNDPLGNWAVKNIRLDGRPFRFEGHEYLRTIYDDPGQHIILSKAAQIGGTVWALLRAIHACMNGLNVIYFFPTRTDVLDFSKSRVGPFLGDNPFIATKMLDTDTAGLKRIGEAHLYFRGMQSKVGMKSVPADMIVFDELDEATPDARSMAWERIAHSDFKKVIELSNPSLPGYGIDEQFEKSDQRHWTLQCPRCNEWTCLDREFPHKLNQEVRIILPDDDGNYYRACIKCGAELDLDKGEWIADFPDRNIHGYRISQLHSSKVNAGEILSEYRSSRHPDRFYNLKIGIPWADLERRLDVQTVLSQCRTGASPKGFAVMGVDTGKSNHAVVMTTTGYSRFPAHIIHLEVCNSFEDLSRLMKRFRVNKCVIDGMPETHATRDFARKHRGRVYLNFFNENQRGSANWDSADHKVLINRTEALDASRSVIRDKHVTLPPLGSANVELFARHMSNDAKVLEEDEETGAKKYKYIRTGEDHFSLAFTYGLMALQSMSMPMTPEAWEALARATAY